MRKELKCRKLPASHELVFNSVTYQTNLAEVVLFAACVLERRSALKHPPPCLCRSPMQLLSRAASGYTWDRSSSRELSRNQTSERSSYMSTGWKWKPIKATVMTGTIVRTSHQITRQLHRDRPLRPPIFRELLDLIRFRPFGESYRSRPLKEAQPLRRKKRLRHLCYAVFPLRHLHVK